MENRKTYLVIDIGTGNVRVAITALDGTVLGIERDNVHYQKDSAYDEALRFSPERLWSQIMVLAQSVIASLEQMEILAITVSSQREGIVLLDKEGKSMMGMPNHDHRGRAWEPIVKDPSTVYVLTGRYPGSLFSAMKLVGLSRQEPEVYSKIGKVLSISDWAQYELCGKAVYEHAQASETLLYDIEQGAWSTPLCEVFGIDPEILPPLQRAGSILGKVSGFVATQLGISQDAVVVVGGADTQLAIKSTRPEPGDVVLVSGTTTPIAMITEHFVVDRMQKTWTGRHVVDSQFILEANAGVTGLNFQRLKDIFYPNESYEVIEKELALVKGVDCMASLGSLVADEEGGAFVGGFLFSIPVAQDLTRAHFAYAALWDIACAIKANFDTLTRVCPYTKDYVWVCGGGFQSATLQGFVATLLNKRIRMRKGNTQASVMGAALVCSQAMGFTAESEQEMTEVLPQNLQEYELAFQEWKQVRYKLKKSFGKN